MSFFLQIIYGVLHECFSIMSSIANKDHPINSFNLLHLFKRESKVRILLQCRQQNLIGVSQNRFKNQYNKISHRDKKCFILFCQKFMLMNANTNKSRVSIKVIAAVVVGKGRGSKWNDPRENVVKINYLLNKPIHPHFQCRKRERERKDRTKKKMIMLVTYTISKCYYFEISVACLMLFASKVQFPSTYGKILNEIWSETLNLFVCCIFYHYWFYFWHKVRNLTSIW